MDRDRRADPLVAAAGDTAADVRDRLRRARRAHWDLLCVLDGEGRLLGTLTPAQLLYLPGEVPVGHAARRDPPKVTAGTSDERMASVALHHAVTALPIVDAGNRLVEVAGARRLMNILRREHVEDLHRLAGITRESKLARQALEGAPARRVRDRLPWLLAGLAGSVLATWVVTRFEATLEARPLLAAFVPGLVYLADAIGTQSEAVAVRGLSLSHMPLKRLIGGELRTGLLIGVLLALLAGPMVWAVFGDGRLATAVALALGTASTLAASLGLVLPWTLQRLGLDPAYGSGPLATIIQDVFSLAIYFGCVSAIAL